MPYCSLSFFNMIGFPVAAHSQWNEAQTLCSLRLFTDHRGARAFLADLSRSSREEARDFARYMMRCALPAESEEETARLEGVVALTLTNLLLLLYRIPIDHIADAPDLIGVWQPPGWRAPSEGMISWFHPDDGYRVVIVHARDQARCVMAGFAWLGDSDQKSLLAGIERWNAPAASGHPAQHIGGVCAKLICYASLAGRKRSTMQASGSITIK